MINPVNIGSTGAVGLRGIDGKRGGTAQAAAAMSTVNSRVAATMARELRLAPVDPRGGYAGGSANDAYGIEQLAAELTAAVGGTPADQGRIARALHEYAGEVATLIASRPVKGTLQGLAFSVVDSDGRPGSTDADYAMSAIQAGTFRLREDAPWASTGE